MSESARTSRQDLVVPPSRSNFPLVLGALLCAGTGFGLVMALGIGRSSADRAAASTRVDPSSPTTAGVDGGQPPTEPALFPHDAPRAEAPRPAGDPGWHPQPAAVAAPPMEDRYPAKPATLETPVDAQPIESSDQKLSRFSAPGRFPGTGDEQVRLASAADEPLEPMPPEPEAGTATGVSLPQAVESTAIETEDATASAPIPSPPSDLQAVEDAPSPPRPDDPAAIPTPPLPPIDTAADSSRMASPKVDQTVPPAAFPPPRVADSFVPKAAQVVQQAGPGDLPPQVAASTVLPRTNSGTDPEPPVAAPRPAAANPFITAVPMVPPPSGERGPVGGAALPHPAAAQPSAMGGAPAGPPGGTGTPGQGRPGPMQLEGVQTPQLAVEKRGPREIQVGKPARYDIVVRNVGNATAQDVTLRDAVPYGTTLIATTPPANPPGPGNGPAELLWPLGPLMPGGEARVAIEVMPDIEGELGSVASVSFRTEASARSRATKPDLRLDATEAKPVRIGGDVQISLTISNPGSGVATGVVVEGLLPEGVIHRAGRELEFDVGQLRPGETRTIDLVMTSTGPGVHQASFTARADGRIEVERAVKVEITAPTLELTAEMPSRRYLQRPATCLLSMINAGTAPARSIELVAQLPPGMKFVRANHSGWYEERSHRVLWSLEELPPGEVGTVEVVVMPVDLGPQKIVAAARSSDGLSDQAAHTVEVEGLAALFFEVTDSEDPIEVGGTTEYIVRVGNQGTKAASGVRLAATLLGDLEPVDAKGPAAHRIENLTFVFDPLVKLSPSEEAVYRVRVRGRRAGDQRMQVQLSSDDHPAPISKEEITRVYADR